MDLYFRYTSTTFSTFQGFQQPIFVASRLLVKQSRICWGFKLRLRQQPLLYHQSVAS